MKLITMLFGTALCLAVIALTYAKPSASTEQHENRNSNRPNRQYPGFYGYQSQWPGNYDHRQVERDLLIHISRLLEERCPSQPQLVYIPYLIQYPIPQNCQCGGQGGNNSDPIINRFPGFEDVRQNWGVVDTEEVDEKEEVKPRPLNFDATPAPTPKAKPPPSPMKGSTQAQIPNAPRRLRRCDALVLSCCNNVDDTRAQRQYCFALSQCAEYFEKQEDTVCSKENIKEVLKLYTDRY